MRGFARALLPVAVPVACAVAVEERSWGPLSLLLSTASRTAARNEDAFLAKADDVAKLADAALLQAGVQDLTENGDEVNEAEAAASRLAVWVTGFPRSGSSTTLALVKAIYGVTEYYEVGRAFALFEPCHGGDELEPSLHDEGCAGLLTRFMNCDFAQVNNLWGWTQPGTTSNHTAYTKSKAKALCEAARVVAFKTVDYGHHLDRFDWFLKEQPSLRVVATVRDPRGILASWKTTPPFPDLMRRCDDCPNGEFYTMTQVCEAYAANLDSKEENVFTIVFEDLLRDPVRVTKLAAEFLGKDFGPIQQSWINSTFNAKECPEVPSWQQGFADCHTKSASGSKAESWREVLTAKERALFTETPSCRAVAAAYGYPMH